MKARTSTADRLLPESRIGDYTIVGELPAEDMAAVYLARHVVLPRVAVVKVMHSQAAWLRSAALQVLREACLLEALSHPGIPRVYECGVLPDRRPWTAFEHIEGTTVAEMVKAGPLPLADVVGMLRDVADLLHHAHVRGVVHRKLIAEAIVKTPDRKTAYAITRWDGALTLDTRTRVDLDTRDDVFALGVIAYRALAGQMPDVKSAAEAVPAAPAELAALIDDMLSTDPSRRPSSEEVKDRTRWLADTIVPLIVERPRWTPPHGVRNRPMTVDDAAAVVEEPGFSIRISRPRSEPSS